MQETNIRGQLAEANQTFRNTFASISEEDINRVPFKDSWTPAQVAQHVYKAEAGMLRALQSPAAEANRDAYAAVSHLKQIFLDFTTKLKSPDMALPEHREYNKDELLQQLADISQKLTDAIPDINPEQLVKGLPTGDLTKGEIIHFLLYHTQRHIHQLQRIISISSHTGQTNSLSREQIVRLINEAFSRNDMPLFLSHCTDNVAWNMIGDKVLQGKEAILQAMTAQPGECPDITVDAIITEGSQTVATGSFNIANKDGVKEAFRYCDVYLFKDDKIAAMDSYVVSIKS